ncbi:hypothetical protein H8959_016432 [Pygathrix nigripes]
MTGRNGRAKGLTSEAGGALITLISDYDGGECNSLPDILESLESTVLCTRKPELPEEITTKLHGITLAFFNKNLFNSTKTQLKANVTCWIEFPRFLDAFEDICGAFPQISQLVAFPDPYPTGNFSGIGVWSSVFQAEMTNT